MYTYSHWNETTNHNVQFLIVYTVWKVNGLLKYVYTWRPVLAKMLGGAGLLLFRCGCMQIRLYTCLLEQNSGVAHTCTAVMCEGGDSCYKCSLHPDHLLRR